MRLFTPPKRVKRSHAWEGHCSHKLYHATLKSIPIRRFCVQKTCSRPTTSYNTCRRPFSSSFATKEKKHYCAAARCRPLSSIRKKNLRYYCVKSSSQCRSVCKKTSCVRSPQRTTAKKLLMQGKRTCFLDAATMGFCAVHRRVQIYNGE
ncbi:uncharacterized protein TNCV_1534691 [Trichonephila clavipes]|nr:uncharacterized protein TNCV_1534691 [Trichonephila clavipes]